MNSKDIIKILFLILFVTNIVSAFELSTLAGNEEEKYLAFAEVMPDPVGGMSAIVKNITYPEIARQSHVEGRVYVLVYVDEEGRCTDAKVIKGIGAGCDEVAVEAVKAVKYTPGMNKGIPVKVKLSLPIVFKL